MASGSPLEIGDHCRERSPEESLQGGSGRETLGGWMSLQLLRSRACGRTIKARTVWPHRGRNRISGWKLQGGSWGQYKEDPCNHQLSINVMGCSRG